jgi:hypothetical protein
MKFDYIRKKIRISSAGNSSKFCRKFCRIFTLFCRISGQNIRKIFFVIYFFKFSGKVLPNIRQNWVKIRQNFRPEIRQNFRSVLWATTLRIWLWWWFSILFTSMILFIAYSYLSTRSFHYIWINNNAMSILVNKRVMYKNKNIKKSIKALVPLSSLVSMLCQYIILKMWEKTTDKRIKYSFSLSRYVK